jgi:hypothetical protein
MVTDLYWANKVLVAHQDVCHEHAKQNSAQPCTKKALDGLFGRYLDQLGTPEGDTTDVGKDVVGDDQ